jgi:D-alanyl-D-alanine carboxypeptidase
MTKSNRLGAAFAAVSLIAVATACAGPGSKGPRSASIFGGKVDTSNIGLATRAQMALASNDIASAISLAERAVDNSPRDAGFRALLGNCYLAAGRFASAEAAYRDSLSLLETQPQLILKLALVQIAQGKADEAKSLLAQAQSVLDPADVGLALALAGDPHSAVAVLEPSARAAGADARTRQNLALAYAFAGNWTMARVVAAQDVPADQLDARIEQWAQLAKPARASDQVAAFIGIQPAAADPGQPVRLALNKAEDVRQAAADPIVEPAPVVEPVAVAAAEPVPTPEPVAETAPELPPVRFAEVRPTVSLDPVRLSEPVARLHRAAAPQPRAGRSKAVVQLGAYSARDRVADAWAKVAGKHGSLKRYTPVTARFSGARGTVYRLAVKGFASDREAIRLCSSLKRAGGSCFVRSVSGDAPVQFASRS